MPSEAQKKANAKYQSKLDRIVVWLQKGEKEIIAKQAEKKGLSVNSYIINLIKKDMESDV